MTPLLYTLGVLAFVLAILASIGLHELGHMIPAKAFGGKVTQYFIGFGPTVWSRRKGETEYGLKAVPLGGYVKIVGMLPPGAEDLGTVEYDENGEQVLRVRKSNTGMFTQLISDARAAEWEHVSPGDEDRLFYKMTWWKKVVVMAGGPTVNLLIAFFIFWGIFATVGNVERVDVEPVVDQVVPCIVPAAEDGRACTARELEENPSPAAAAGLQPGDRFVSFNGTPVTDWKALQTAIRENDDKTAAIVVDRDGQQVSLEVTTQVVPRPVSDDVADTTLTPVGFLGVQPVQTAVVVTGGPIYTLQQMDTMAVNTVEGAGHPAGQGLRGRQGAARARGARRRQPGQHRRGRPDRRRVRLGRRVPGPGQARRACWPSSPGSTSSSACSTSCRSSRSTAATSPARSTRRCGGAGPGCGTAPTRATSTSRSCCRSPT